MQSLLFVRMPWGGKAASCLLDQGLASISTMTELMERAKKLNWRKDDGVFFWMLNDGLRNEFYFEALQRAAPGKVVLDIGLGAGVLTIMALKAGAKKVIAYEQNRERFEYAQAVIHRLGYSDRVELHLGCFSNCKIPKETIDVIVTETFAGDPFSEGILNSIERLKKMPLSSDFVMIPDVLDLKARLYMRPMAEKRLCLTEDSNLPIELLDIYNQTLGASTAKIRSTSLDPRTQSLGTPEGGWKDLPTLDMKALLKSPSPAGWGCDIHLPENSEGRLSLLLSWDMKSTATGGELRRSCYQGVSDFYAHWNFLGFVFDTPFKEERNFHMHVIEEKDKLAGAFKS